MLRIARRLAPNPNAFIPYSGSPIEQMLIRAGALSYDAPYTVEGHPELICYGKSCWMDSADTPDIGGGTIIRLGTILAYEPSSKTRSGYHVFDCSATSAVDQRSKQIFTRGQAFSAFPVKSALPRELYTADILQTEDGWKCITQTGIQHAKAGRAFWVQDGWTCSYVPNEAGEPIWSHSGPSDLFVLDRDDPAIAEYWLIDESKNVLISPLVERLGIWLDSISRLA